MDRNLSLVLVALFATLIGLGGFAFSYNMSQLEVQEDVARKCLDNNARLIERLGEAKNYSVTSLANCWVR